MCVSPRSPKKMYSSRFAEASWAGVLWGKSSGPKQGGFQPHTQGHHPRDIQQHNFRKEALLIPQGGPHVTEPY